MSNYVKAVIAGAFIIGMGAGGHVTIMVIYLVIYYTDATTVQGMWLSKVIRQKYGDDTLNIENVFTHMYRLV